MYLIDCPYIVVCIQCMEVIIILLTDFCLLVSLYISLCIQVILFFLPRMV